MKRVATLILTLVMCFLVCSCAKSNSADNSDTMNESKETASPVELILGTWEGEISPQNNGYLKFMENGHLVGRFGDVYTDDGKYTITEDTLTLSWLENGVHPATYECDLISLTKNTLSFAISEGAETYTYTLYRK